MTISCMTIISALLSPKLIKTVHTKWIVVGSICLTVAELFGLSFAGQYWMLFLFAAPSYGLGAVISPNLMAPALKLKYARWNE